MTNEDFVREVYQTSYRVGQLIGPCGDVSTAEEVVQEAFVRAAPRSDTPTTRRPGYGRLRSIWRAAGGAGRCAGVRAPTIAPPIQRRRSTKAAVHHPQAGARV